MGKIINLSEPEIIRAHHLLDHFSSGNTTLDEWLIKRALKNYLEGASKTYVVHHNNRVVAYYCLATGSIQSKKVPGKIRRNMPNPIPALILGRLAVDTEYQRFGLGKGLLKDAFLRTLNVSRDVGIRALLVHAISDSAKHFYKRFGFVESPLDEMTLMLSVTEIDVEFQQTSGVAAL